MNLAIYIAGRKRAQRLLLSEGGMISYCNLRELMRCAGRNCGLRTFIVVGHDFI